MTKPKIKWNSEKALSFSAMTISFLTLIIFIYQTNLMSRQNHLSIMPYLNLSTGTNTVNNTFRVDLENYGVGPAIIESVKLKYQGETYDLINYDGHLTDFLLSIVPVLDSIKTFSSSTLDPGMAIPANTVYNVFSVSDSADFQLMTVTLDQLLEKGLDYEITYKSIQDERWLIRQNLQGPEKLR